MRELLQIVVGLGLLILAQSNFGDIKIDFAIVALWLMSWLGERTLSFAYAVTAGLLFDMVSFFPFGFWTLQFIAVTAVIDWLKNRFLTVSSFWQALLVLVLATIFSHLSVAVPGGNFNYLLIITSIVANAIFGSILYYLFVIRLKLLQRWIGKRL